MKLEKKAGSKRGKLEKLKYAKVKIGKGKFQIKMEINLIGKQ